MVHWGTAPRAARCWAVLFSLCAVWGLHPRAHAAEVTAVIDFDSQGLPAGTIVSSIEGDAGGTPVGPIPVNGTKPSNPIPNFAILFDSANPPGIDFDLGTPNETFGGPGVGPAGEMGQPFENGVPLHNILVFAQDLIDTDEDGLVDVPNDAFERNMVFDFDFSTISAPFTPEDVTLLRITTIDGENSESPGLVRLFNSRNVLISTTELPESGCNGVRLHDIGAPGVGVSGVARMEVVLNGSGGIDDILFKIARSPEPVADLQCEITDVCTCETSLTWTNTEADYDAIRIEVDGVVAATLPGSSTSHVLNLPGPGASSICVIPEQAGFDADPTCCNAMCPEVLALPPSNLDCAPDTLDCSVVVSWINSSDYSFITVLLDGAVVATLPGTADTITLDGPLEGMHMVCLTGETICGVPLPQVCCDFECAITPPSPVTNLNCDVDPCSCVATLFWTNTETNYDEIDITRNGTVVATLPGNAMTYMDTLPGPATYDLCVIPRRSGVDGRATCCPAVCPDIPATSPANLKCNVGLPPDCVVSVSWENTSEYATIEVSLDGTVVATLPGSAQAASVALPGPGTFEICLNGTTVCNEAFPEICCTVDCPFPPDPVEDLQCTLLDLCSCMFTLTWTNASSDYDEIQIAVNGVVKTLLAGDLETVTLVLPNGMSEICVTPVRNTLPADPPTCCTVDCPEVPVLPPSNLACTPDTFDCSVAVTWTNSSEYAFITVLLDGLVVDTLPGTAESYTFTGPVVGNHLVCLQGETICGFPFDETCCRFECMIDPPAMVTDLVCDVPDPCTCLATLVWVNTEATYDEIDITLNGTVVATLPGNATTHAEMLPGVGSHELCVVPRRFGVDGPAACCMVECPVTEAFPPKMLVCSVNPTDCSALITWNNLSLYSFINVLLNGVVVQTLPGNAEEATVIITLQGTNTICLEGETVCGEAFPQVCCDVVCPTLVTEPVENLLCEITDPCVCDAQLTWANGGSYDEIQILLDGALLDTLAGTETAYEFTLPGNGDFELCVVPVRNAVPADETCCMLGCPEIPPTGPANIACDVSAPPDCVVTVTWTNTSVYQQIIVTVNGDTIATLPGDAEAAIVPLPGSGASEICLTGATICGNTFAPVCCSVQCEVPFIRGECNDDDRGLDIADAIFILNFFFQNGAAPHCLAACDMNMDTFVDLSDTIFAFQYLFNDGPMPSQPFPDCGIEPGADCEFFNSCP